MTPEAKVARANRDYLTASDMADRARAARNAAIAAAHDAGMTYQAIATLCDMSIDNARRCVREHNRSS